MAKVRKQRREEREMRMQAARELETARSAKRVRRRESWRRVTLYELRQRSSGRLLARRSRGERAFIGALTLVIFVVIWATVPSLALRLALSLLFVLVLPVLMIVAFDRRSS